jgi:hypothetical protein
VFVCFCQHATHTSSYSVLCVRPAYGGVEVLQLSLLYHPEEGFEK